MKAPLQPRQRWSLDLAFGFKPVRGYTGILIFCENFSLYTILVPIKGKSANEITQIFRDRIYVPFNVEEVHSDNEPAVGSEVFQNFCDQKGIKSTQMAAYSPWQNQNCENPVKLLKSAIKI